MTGSSMTCTTFAASLSGWIDAELGEALAREMRRHADSCSACGSLERSLRDLTAALRDLPREDAPAPGAWPAIEARILRERTTSPTTRWLAFAAVLVLVLLGGWIASRHASIQAPPTAAPVASAPSVPPVLASADATLLEARSALDEVLAARSTRLSPETIRALAASLAEMESATRKIRDALAKDPSNKELQQMLVASHRRQLSVMRDVTILAARQDKTPTPETAQ